MNFLRVVSTELIDPDDCSMGSKFKILPFDYVVSEIRRENLFVD